jgi:hypothetical protein
VYFVSLISLLITKSHYSLSDEYYNVSILVLATTRILEHQKSRRKFKITKYTYRCFYSTFLREMTQALGSSVVFKEILITLLPTE